MLLNYLGLKHNIQFTMSVILLEISIIWTKILQGIVLGIFIFPNMNWKYSFVWLMKHLESKVYRENNFYPELSII